MITRIDVMPARPSYRTGRAKERYAEERLWQRALGRLEGPQQPAKSPKKKEPEQRRVSSFAAVLRAVQEKLGRHVDMLV